MPIISNSIGELISDIAQKNSDRDALVYTEAGQRYSYQDLSYEVDRAARGFLSRGIRPGDKIALWSPNVPEWMIAFLGLAKMGAVTVPIDPAATKDNLYPGAIRKPWVCYGRYYRGRGHAGHGILRKTRYLSFRTHHRHQWISRHRPDFVE